VEHPKLKAATFCFGETFFKLVAVNLLHVFDFVALWYRFGKERWI
jgi:hypothetical protein